MTVKQYLKDPALRGEMTIAAILTADRPIVRTVSTWFHAQGGGQKPDRGTLGDIEIYCVKHAENGEVDHFVTSLDGLEVGGTYPFAIDPDWRRLNANYHSGGHLLAAVAEASFPGVTAVNGHHWPGEARVEFRGDDLDRIANEVTGLECAVNEAIAAHLPIVIVGDPMTDRKVQIGDFAPLPCGGTHASLTSEIGRIQIRSAKLKGDIIRVGYDVLGTS